MKKNTNSQPMLEDSAIPEVAIASPYDPLLCNLQMPLRAVVYPLGFPLEITTNSPEVIVAAKESWGHFSQAFSQPALQLRVGVMGTGSRALLSQPTHRGWLNLILTVADAENFALCDLRAGVAFAWLTEAALADRLYVRYYFLEGPVLSMLQHLYLVPVHAACVNLAHRGVLLCGDSGAGKSSLAYACARRGWTFIADDTVSLIRGQRELRVVGNPHRIRLREAGVELFPELSEHHLVTQVSGERAIELSTAKVTDISTALTSPVQYVVFLNRRNCNPPGLVPFSKQKALSWFEKEICYGDEQARQAQVASLRELLKAEIFELRYRDLSTAVDLLETHVLNCAEHALPTESTTSVPPQKNE